MATISAPSKSQAVRDYVTEHPDAMPRAIKAALKEQYGLDVARQMISNIKQQLKTKTRGGRKTKARRGRPAGVGRRGGRRPAAARGSDADISMSDLLAAKELAERLGGIDAAKRAVDVLKKLS
jgi:hypothetical protein